MSSVRLAIIPRVLVYYRVHQSQISAAGGGAEVGDEGWMSDMAGSADYQGRLRVGLLSVCTGKYIR